MYHIISKIDLFLYTQWPGHRDTTRALGSTECCTLLAVIADLRHNTHRRQKRPIAMPKETYFCTKRDLLLCQRRPNDTRITRYGVSVKRALLQWQKRPNDAGMYAEWREASLRPKLASFTSIWALFWHLCMHNWGMFMWKGLIWHINRTLCP